MVSRCANRKRAPAVSRTLAVEHGRRGLRLPQILSVYMSGSKNMSYDSASLTTPDIKWLGVRPSDLDEYNIPPQCRACPPLFARWSARPPAQRPRVRAQACR
jgi:hypothetical protein